MRSIILGTAGHIDHGKSALVKALSGTDPDRLKEEQARGITIDLGFAHLTLGDTDFAFVDVPGHERFVRNMLAGAGGFDAVLLVVAADESVMPQTREHFDICRLLDITQGLVVLTKSDLVDSDTIELAALEVRELTAGSFLDGAPVLPVSTKTGAGLDALKAALQRLQPAASRSARAGVPRVPVDRVFSVRGFGTVVTGTLVSGTVAEGDELIALPQDDPVRVRGVQVHGRPAARADAPRRVALNLGSIEVTDLSRGVTLTTAGGLAVTRRFDARLSLIASAKPLRHGARVRIHQGTDEVLGRLALSAVQNPGAPQWLPVQVGQERASVAPGQDAYVRIRLERPMVCTRGDRVVIRAYSPPRTIGGAVVLDAEPSAGGIRRPSALARFLQLDTVQCARVWLAEAGLRGINAADLVRRGGLDPADAARCAQDLCGRGVAVCVRDRLFDAPAISTLELDLVRTLERFHDAHPLEAGMPRDTLRETIARGAPHDLFDAVVTNLIARALLGGSDRLGLRSRVPTLDPEVARARERVERAVGEAGLMPPDAAALAAAVDAPTERIDQVVHLLVRDRRLQRLGPLLFHTDALARLRADVVAMKGTTPELDVAIFKSRYGLSRKFAIPLLEWLDRERVTRRVGERRIIL
jgi:selenocysteine-specific elongation factor